MLSYCLKCRQNTEKLQGQKTEEQCFHHEVRDSKKSKFFEQQEVTEFLNSFF